MQVLLQGKRASEILRLCWPAFFFPFFGFGPIFAPHEGKPVAIFPLPPWFASEERPQWPFYGRREHSLYAMTVEDATLRAHPLRVKPAQKCASLAPLPPLSLKTSQKFPCATSIAHRCTGPSWLIFRLRVQQARASCRSGGKSGRTNGQNRQSYRFSGNQRRAA